MRNLVVTDVATTPPIVPINTYYMMSVGVEEKDITINNWGELSPYIWLALTNSTWGAL